MTALYIVLCVVAVVAFLVIMPVKIKATFTDSLTLKAGYLFLWFTLVPAKEKKKKKKKTKDKKEAPKEEKPKENENKSTIQDIIKEQGIGGFLHIINQAVTIIKGLISDITDHLIICKFNLNIAVASDDAADTAIQYGEICAVLYPAVSFIFGNVKKVKKQNISVMPDFNKKSTEISADVFVKISVIFIIFAAVHRGIQALKLMLKLRSAPKNKQPVTSPKQGEDK